MDESCDNNIPSHHRYDDDETTKNDESPSTTTKPLLDNIIVGYAFGRKKMETMGLIMAEASKAFSTFECAGNLSSMINGRRTHQQQQQQQNNNDAMEHLLEESSMVTSVATAAASSMVTTGQETARESSMEDNLEKESVHAAASRTHYFSEDNEEDVRSMSSTYTRASFISQRSSQQRGPGGVSNNGGNGIQFTFLTDSSGFIHLVRTSPSSGGGNGTGVAGGEGESITGSSITTSATTLTPCLGRLGAPSSTASCSSIPLSLTSSLSKEKNESPYPGSLGLPITVKQKKGCQSYSSTRSSTRWRSNGSSGGTSNLQRHPIRVSFVPIDLDTPLEEQHGGKFDVILHKMTEDILCMSKMLRSRGQSWSSEGVEKTTAMGEDGNCNIMQPPPTAQTNQPPTDQDPSNPFEATPSMTRHQARASRRIQRLNKYKQEAHPSCVLVDSPQNILAVMSRADMAEVLSRCLAGVTTKGGIPVRTPRFRVVEEDCGELSGIGEGSEESTGSMHQHPTIAALADEIDSSGFSYPFIAKPLTAAGTKSSHHMGIVLARDGLQRLKTPCILQEYANHGEKLFKVYVLGESVWVFSRESLPNLPLGENKKDINSDCDPDRGSPMSMHEEGEQPCRRMLGDDAQSLPRYPRKRLRTMSESYVEFERPAGSRCYVEFNSQRPYPKLSDFGIVSPKAADQKSFDDNTMQGGVISEQCQQRLNAGATTFDESSKDMEDSQNSTPAQVQSNNMNTTTANCDLARCVTKDEIEPVTTALRDAFGLELFGFDVLVKHGNNKNSSPRIGSSNHGDEEKEILVVDVNYFPGYKEVPNFPSLLAQYLTQKALESRLRMNVDGSER